MAKPFDWWDALGLSNQISREHILAAITSVLNTVTPEHYLSLETRCGGYEKMGKSMTWIPIEEIHFVRRVRTGRTQDTRFICGGGPGSLKYIQVAVIEAAKEQDLALVVTYWREGFVLCRLWGSESDLACADEGHKIIDMVVCGLHQHGDLRSSLRCMCGAKQNPDTTDGPRLASLFFPDFLLWAEDW